MLNIYNNILVLDKKVTEVVILLTGNSKLIKHLNKKRVLNLIRQKSSISRIELAKLTKLNPSTITDIVSRLIKEDMIIEQGVGISTGGRRPHLLKLNPKNFLYIGLSVHLHIHAVVVDINGNVISQLIVRLDDNSAFDFNKLVSFINKITNKAGIAIDKFKGIGVGVPGQVDPDTGMVKYAPHIKLSEFPIKESLKKVFDVPIFVDNGMKAKALAEMWFGEGKDVKNFVLLNIEEGIGSAIVINKKIYRGFTQKAGEIGHNYRKRNNIEKEKMCHCGNAGCLETVAGEKAIIDSFKKEIETGYEFPHSEITLKTIFDAWRSGDSLAIEVINKVCFNLGITIADLFNMLDPQKLIISGSIINEGKNQFLSRMIEIANEHTFGGLEESRVVRSKLGDHGLALGAATIAMHDFFENLLVSSNT